MIVIMPNGSPTTLEAVTNHPKDFNYVGVLSYGWWISEVWEKERGWMDDKEQRAANLKKIAADFISLLNYYILHKEAQKILLMKTVRKR